MCKTQRKGFDAGRRFYQIKYRHTFLSELPEAPFTVTGEKAESPGHNVTAAESKRSQTNHSVKIFLC